jgi:glycerate kinase
MKITINKQELEFKFKFSQLKELTKITKTDLAGLEEIAKDFNNASLIASIGTGKTIEEIEQMLDEDGTFEAVTEIISAFSGEVLAYFNPNSQNQVS